MVSALSPFNSTNLAKHSSTSISSKASKTLPFSPPGKVTRGSTDQSAIVFLESPESMSALPKASVSDDAPSQLLYHVGIVFVTCRLKNSLIRHHDLEMMHCNRYYNNMYTTFHLPFFCKTLKRRGRCMNAIITLVRDRSKSKFLVVVKDGLSNRSLWAFIGVSGS